MNKRRAALVSPADFLGLDGLGVFFNSGADVARYLDVLSGGLT
jgi:hypothetical protein